MLYDYFTKSAMSLPTMAAVGGLAGAGAGALGSELSGGDWKDNLLNAAGAGIGTAAGGVGGVATLTPLVLPVWAAHSRSRIADRLRAIRTELKTPNIHPSRKAQLVSTADLTKTLAPKKRLPGNSKVLKLGQLLIKNPFLSLGTFAGLGGGLGYATTNAFTGKEEKTVQDIIKDILGKA